MKVKELFKNFLKEYFEVSEKSQKSNHPYKYVRDWFLKFLNNPLINEKIKLII